MMFPSAEPPSMTDSEKEVTENKPLDEAVKSGKELLSYDEQPKSRTYPFFFCGTLMDLEVLRAVSQISKEPVLEDAWIEGFEMKMWQGLYPVLLPLSHDVQNSGTEAKKIYGKKWCAMVIDQCLQLQRYASSAYTTAECKIHVQHPGGGSPEAIMGRTSVWARNPDDDKLKDGTFDLEHWRTVVKPTAWR